MRAEATIPAGAIPESLVEPSLYVGKVTPGSLDDQVLAFPETKPPKQWYLALAITLTAALIGVGCIGYTFYLGIGAWGNTSPVFWAFDIINFVFWVGIGHAGTLI
jgi:hypothetical protein